MVPAARCSARQQVRRFGSGRVFSRARWTVVHLRAGRSLVQLLVSSRFAVRHTRLSCFCFADRRLQEVLSAGGHLEHRLHFCRCVGSRCGLARPQQRRLALYFTICMDFVFVWEPSEMHNGRPLFPGETEEAQLDVIFRKMGTPTEETCPALLRLPGWKVRVACPWR